MIPKLDLLEVKMIYYYILKSEAYPFLTDHRFTRLYLTSHDYFALVCDLDEVVMFDGLPKLFILQTDKNYLNTVEFDYRGFGGFWFMGGRKMAIYSDIAIRFSIDENGEISAFDNSYGGVSDERAIFKIALTILMNLLWYVWDLENVSLEGTYPDWEEVVERLNRKLRKHGEFWKSIDNLFTEAAILGRLL